MKRFASALGIVLGTACFVHGASEKSAVFAAPSSFLKRKQAQGRTARIKDIAHVEGVRENFLVGYGLVVGLGGTGDTIQSIPFTRESITAMLERLGVNVRMDNKNLHTRNVAAVMVTAKLPAFMRPGSHLDVQVSAIGDAKSLRGGFLLVTSLLGADGKVYSVAQGPVSVGGYYAEGRSGSSVQKNVPTRGGISGGAIIERAVCDSQLSKDLRLILHRPDFTTACRMASAINRRFGEALAKAQDFATVHVRIPDRFRGKESNFVAQMEQLHIVPDHVAKIVVDESNGIVLMTENVRLAPFAVSIGSLSIRVDETKTKLESRPSAAQSLKKKKNASDPIVTSKENTSSASIVKTQEEWQKASETETAEAKAVREKAQETVDRLQKKLDQTQTRLSQKSIVRPNNADDAEDAEDNTTVDFSEHRSIVSTTENGQGIAYMASGPTLNDLVKGFRALGLSNTEMATLMQTLSASGALIAGTVEQQ